MQRVLFSESGVATPALFRWPRTSRRRRRWPQLPFCEPDNGGCSQATAWVLRLTESSLKSSRFPPFFPYRRKGIATENLVEEISWRTTLPPPAGGGQSFGCSLSCRNNQYAFVDAWPRFYTLRGRLQPVSFVRPSSTLVSWICIELWWFVVPLCRPWLSLRFVIGSQDRYNCHVFSW